MTVLFVKFIQLGANLRLGKVVSTKGLIFNEFFIFTRFINLLTYLASNQSEWLLWPFFIYDKYTFTETTPTQLPPYHFYMHILYCCSSYLKNNNIGWSEPRRISLNPFFFFSLTVQNLNLPPDLVPSNAWQRHY